MRRSAPAAAVIGVSLLLGGCAGIARSPGDVAAYCAPDNAVRLGSEGRAYLGGCPPERESAFLAGLERGRALRLPPPQAQPYLERIAENERLLVAAASEAEREPLRQRLREAEWWAIHLLNAPGSYNID